MDIITNGKMEKAVIDAYKESIKKVLDDATRPAMEQENLRLTRELTEIREKAINMIAQERKAVIGKIVEDEKKMIWAQAHELHTGDGLHHEAIKADTTQANMTEKQKPAEIVPPITGHAAPGGHAPAIDSPKHNPAVINATSAAPAPAPMHSPVTPTVSAAPTAAVPPVSSPVATHVSPVPPIHAPAAMPSSPVPTAAVPPVQTPAVPPIPTGAAAPPVHAPSPQTQVYEEKMELEILPPRDQKEIEAVHEYLKHLPEISSLQLVTLVEKSIFKVTLNKPMNLMAKLNTVPQIYKAEEVREDGKTKIRIYLSVKIKLEKNQAEVNTKVNKIFGKKK